MTMQAITIVVYFVLIFAAVDAGIAILTDRHRLVETTQLGQRLRSEYLKRLCVATVGVGAAYVLLWVLTRR